MFEESLPCFDINYKAIVIKTVVLTKNWTRRSMKENKVQIRPTQIWPIDF